MSGESKLTITQRLEVQEAKLETLAIGLNQILTDFARIDEAKKVQEEKPWDPSNIVWTQATGARGLYERANSQTSTDFKLLLADLKAHDGKLRRDGFFYWVFSDAATVGRKHAYKR